VVRLLVPVSSRDDVQGKVSSLIPLLEPRLLRDPRAEFYFGRTADLGKFSYPHGLREDLLQPVFKILDDINRLIISQLDDQLHLAFRLGGVVDQIACPSRVFLHLQERISATGSFETVRSPGDVTPQDDWFYQIQQLVIELQLSSVLQTGVLSQLKSLYEDYLKDRRTLESLKFSARSPVMFAAFTGLLPDWFPVDQIGSWSDTENINESNIEEIKKIVTSIELTIKNNLEYMIKLAEDAIRQGLSNLPIRSTPQQDGGSHLLPSNQTRDLIVTIDSEESLIDFKGRTYVVSLEQAKFVEALINSRGPISSPQLSKLDGLSGCCRFDRLRDKLPSPIRILIVSEPGKGFRLNLE
jgi:hypothetical protein